MHITTTKLREHQLQCLLHICIRHPMSCSYRRAQTLVRRLMLMLLLQHSEEAQCADITAAAGMSRSERTHSDMQRVACMGLSHLASL